ncbi:Ubiquinone/menaquinone biosynthesis C-methyltransferase UbiE [Candidatus Burarchaeum australiense]|nr:Ubiquinone/menaquinone biosynthesis C-methyltransferase UbiE [Candidatus Burarchaeum australiense]
MAKQTDDERFQKDLQALKFSAPLFIRLAWDCLVDVGAENLLKKGCDLKQLSSALNINNTDMLECMLDVLVGEGCLKYENTVYHYIRSPPNPPVVNVRWLKKNNPASMKWVDLCYSSAKNALHGRPADLVGFDKKVSVLLWDKMMEESPYSFRLFAIRKFAKDLPDSAVVLDFGGGGGIALENILKETTAKIFLEEFERSNEYLFLAKKRINDLFKKTKSDIIKENIRRMVFRNNFDISAVRDNTYDVIFMSLVLHHIPSTTRGNLLAELQRILKPGGKFVAYHFIHKSKFERNPIWLMYSVPTHQGYPFKDEYLNLLRKNFSSVEDHFGGLVTVAIK